jgi:hypothetical protein
MFEGIQLNNAKKEAEMSWLLDYLEPAEGCICT